jgi:phosphoribosylanthranilate isomerase
MAAERRPRVKICGITRLEDALLAVDLGATALGFVFWPSSPRFIAPGRALGIVEQLPALVMTVGVFVNQPLESIEAVSSQLSLRVVQLHGSEAPAFCAAVSIPVIKAIAVADADADAALELARRYPGATLLLDAHDPVRVGGTGRTIDWTVAERLGRERHVFLSGGLTPENVREAVAVARPYGVDVSSGVESAPGIKSPERLRALFAAVDAIGEFPASGEERR